MKACQPLNTPSMNILFGAAIPEKYKDGQPFYFTINRIDSNPVYLAYCTPTKYVAEINSFSDNPCGQTER
jgi:hypothetical protein